jgi:hypothetical protein
MTVIATASSTFERLGHISPPLLGETTALRLIAAAAVGDIAAEIWRARQESNL